MHHGWARGEYNMRPGPADATHFYVQMLRRGLWHRAMVRIHEISLGRGALSVLGVGSFGAAVEWVGVA